MYAGSVLAVGTCGCQSLEGLVRYLESVTTHFRRGQPGGGKAFTRFQFRSSQSGDASVMSDATSGSLTFELHDFSGRRLGQTLETDLTGQSQTDTAAAQQETHLTDARILGKTNKQFHLPTPGVLNTPIM